MLRRWKMKTEEDYKWIFRLIDRQVRKEKLFLRAGFSLLDCADTVGVNRTYASRAICTEYSGFRDYMNTLRIEFLLEALLHGSSNYEQYEDMDDFAMQFGFRNLRSLNRSLKYHTGYSLCGFMRHYSDSSAPNKDL